MDTWTPSSLRYEALRSANACTLSSLSTAEQMVRNLSSGTPQTANIPSSRHRWFTCAGQG